MVVNPGYSWKNRDVLYVSITITAVFLIAMSVSILSESTFHHHTTIAEAYFYSNLGVKVLKGVNYLLPIQVDGDVEEMIKLSKNVISIPRKSIADFINSVYTDVYDYRKTDLLRRTITNLPDVIDIKGLKVRDL